MRVIFESIQASRSAFRWRKMFQRLERGIHQVGAVCFDIYRCETSHCMFCKAVVRESKLSIGSTSG